MGAGMSDGASAMTITEAERRYLSSDWCMAVSFADFLRLLKNEGVVIDFAG